MTSGWEISLTIGFLVLAATLIIPCGGSDVIQHRVGYQATVHLWCKNERNDVVGANRPDPQPQAYSWIGPSNAILSVDNTTSSDMDDKYTLLQNGLILRIGRITPDDFGLYICLMFRNETSQELLGMIKHTVASNNPDFKTGDVLSRYVTPIKYGSVAGVVVLVVMALLCYNYTRYQDRHDAETAGRVVTSDQSMQHVVSQQNRWCSSCQSKLYPEMFHYNEGFVNDEIQEPFTNNEKEGNSAKELIATAQTRL